MKIIFLHCISNDSYGGGYQRAKKTNQSAMICATPPNIAMNHGDRSILAMHKNLDWTPLTDPPYTYMSLSHAINAHDTSNATRPIHPTTAIRFLLPSPPPPLSAPLSFATVAVPVAPPCTTTPVAVQLVPHAYPLGQHPPPPPPWPPGQGNHPCAHPPPVAAAVAPPPSGTAIVTPSLLTASVEEATGQDVRLQSRPTWQQPPW